jgi:hypothetical protein
MQTAKDKIQNHTCRLASKSTIAISAGVIVIVAAPQLQLMVRLIYPVKK